MDLNFFTRQTHTVNYTDLNRFIAIQYNKPGFKGTIESSNDTTHEYTVDGSEADEAAAILDTGSCEHWRLGAVLDLMHRDGLIPSGNWLVRVSW